MKVKKLFRSSDCSDYSLEYNLNRLMELIVQEGWEIENVFQLTSYLGKIENYILASIEVENLEELESDNPKNLFRMGSFSRENRIERDKESINTLIQAGKRWKLYMCCHNCKSCLHCEGKQEELYRLCTQDNRVTALNVIKNLSDDEVDKFYKALKGEIDA